MSLVQQVEMGSQVTARPDKAPAQNGSAFRQVLRDANSASSATQATSSQRSPSATDSSAARATDNKAEKSKTDRASGPSTPTTSQSLIDPNDPGATVAPDAPLSTTAMLQQLLLTASAAPTANPAEAGPQVGVGATSIATGSQPGAAGIGDSNFEVQGDPVVFQPVLGGVVIGKPIPSTAVKGSDAQTESASPELPNSKPEQSAVGDGTQVGSADSSARHSAIAQGIFAQAIEPHVGATTGSVASRSKTSKPESLSKTALISPDFEIANCTPDSTGPNVSAARTPKEGDGDNRERDFPNGLLSHSNSATLSSPNFAVAEKAAASTGVEVLTPAFASVAASQAGEVKSPSAIPLAQTAKAGESQFVAAQEPSTHPLGAVQSARLVQNLSTSELHVGVEAGEFGRVEIHTSITPTEMTTKIYVQHDDLARVLSAELPALHEKFAVEHRLSANVELHNSGSESQSESGRHGNPYHRTTDLPDSMRPSAEDSLPVAEASIFTTNSSTHVGLDAHA